MNSLRIRREDLIYPELSYRIVGVLFNVFNVIGSNHKEAFYQKAAARDFQEDKLSFEE